MPKQWAPWSVQCRDRDRVRHQQQGTFGAIIQATGFNLYDPADLAGYNYTNSADIITNEEMEILAEMLTAARIKRPSDGKRGALCCILQNVGPELHRKGNSPTIQVSRSYRDQGAMYFKELNGECDTTICSITYASPGAAGEDFTAQAGEDDHL